MTVVMTELEARVIGSLMEKSVLTPDLYPMTINALTNACNQKSSRDPVMHLEPGKVLQTVRTLEGKRLIRTERNPRTEVEKYAQRLCNTPFSDFQFDPAEFAIMCVLLLRGPRTPGELRTNSGRLHEFADNAAVVHTLGELTGREGQAVVVELPRTLGRRDAEYAHLLSGELDMEALASARQQPPARTRSPGDDLEARVATLEKEVAALRSFIEASLGEAPR